MQALTPARRLDIVITSDHGFAQHTEGVNIVESLIAAGLKANAGVNGRDRGEPVAVDAVLRAVP